jgi:hypothetical protein
VGARDSLVILENKNTSFSYRDSTSRLSTPYLRHDTGNAIVIIIIIIVVVVVMIIVVIGVVVIISPSFTVIFIVGVIFTTSDSIPTAASSQDHTSK